ncbi:unnamed protein product, partial [Ixodes hexagonus]
GFLQVVPVLVCGLGLVAFGQKFGCPDADTLRPCSCDMDGISCRKAKSTQELKKAFGSADLKEHGQLWVVKTSVESFPEDVLGDFVFREIHLNLNVNLTSFSIDSLKNSGSFVTNISLYGNALSTFEFARIRMFPKLTSLNLGNNRLDAIPDRAFDHAVLTTLVLSDNPIRTLGSRAFAALPKLELLHIVGTRITTLGDYALTLSSTSPVLRVFLKNSPLVNISNLTFADSSPYSLSLARNNLTTFSEVVFGPLLRRMHEHVIRTNRSLVLDVTKNPFSCSGCSFRWLVSHKRDLVAQNLLFGFRCADGTRLKDLTMRSILC